MARKKADPLLSFDLRLTRLEKRVLAIEGIINKIYAIAEKIKMERGKKNADR